MTIRNLEYLLAPKSVAMIGASPEPGSVGGRHRNLRAGGFDGPIWLVNPGHSDIDGVPVMLQWTLCRERRIWLSSPRRLTRFQV